MDGVLSEFIPREIFQKLIDDDARAFIRLGNSFRSPHRPAAGIVPRRTGTHGVIVQGQEKLLFVGLYRKSVPLSLGQTDLVLGRIRKEYLVTERPECDRKIPAAFAAPRILSVRVIGTSFPGNLLAVRRIENYADVLHTLNIPLNIDQRS